MGDHLGLDGHEELAHARLVDLAVEGEAEHVILRKGKNGDHDRVFMPKTMGAPKGSDSSELIDQPAR